MKSSCEERGYAKGMYSDSHLGGGDFQILSSIALHLNRFKLLEIYVTRPNFSQEAGWRVMMRHKSRHRSISLRCLFIFSCHVACYRICFLLAILIHNLLSVVSFQLYSLQHRQHKICERSYFMNFIFLVHTLVLVSQWCSTE